jgi:hypothetical protein
MLCVWAKTLRVFCYNVPHYHWIGAIISRRGIYETSVRASGHSKIMKTEFHIITLNRAYVSQSHRQPSFLSGFIRARHITSPTWVSEMFHTEVTRSQKDVRHITTCVSPSYSSIRRVICVCITNSVAQEPEGSSPHSQQPATGSCPEPVESNPHTPSQSP